MRPNYAGNSIHIYVSLQENVWMIIRHENILKNSRLQPALLDAGVSNAYSVKIIVRNTPD